MRGLGTIINVAATLAGGALGLLLKGGLKEKYQSILMQALGLATMFIGVSGALKGMFTVNEAGTGLQVGGSLLMILTLAIGSIIGEFFKLEERMDGFGEWLKKKTKSESDNMFVEGFVGTSLVICVGAMAIVGALEDGLQGNPATLIAKSILDGIILIVLASTYGKGALFAAIPLGIWQGSITALAGVIRPILTDVVIADLSFVGNALIFCVGVNLAFGKKFRVANMLPSLLFVILFDLIPIAVFQGWMH